MAKQDDRNREHAIDLIEQLHDRINVLEEELDQAQDAYDELLKKVEMLEDELTDIKYPE